MPKFSRLRRPKTLFLALGSSFFFYSCSVESTFANVESLKTTNVEFYRTTVEKKKYAVQPGVVPNAHLAKIVKKYENHKHQMTSFRPQTLPEVLVSCVGKTIIKF